VTRVAKKWIRTAADERAVAMGCTFDLAAGRHVCDFLATYCRQSKGRWRGLPISLMDWQRDFLMRLFGWRRADGRRRFRRAYLEVAKKNGKSTLVSGLTLYLLLADDAAPEVYINASDREQASIIYDEAARMVEASPELAKRLEVIPSKKRIVDPIGHGKIVANSADVPSKDGVNASAVIFDELHRQPNRDLWDIFEYAGASREQPLHISITTAGEDTKGVWHEQREYSEKINAGVLDDITHLGVTYRALPGDDFGKVSTWRKANPSLGVTVDEETFGRELAEAREIPSKWTNFLRLRLGVVSGSTARFVSPERWAACAESHSPEDGRECYIGLDMSSRVDLTALVAIFPDGAGGVDVLTRCWTPSDTLTGRERQDQAPYRVWADEGFLDVCDGGEIDYEAVRAAVVDLTNRFDVRMVAADPWNAKQFLQECDRDGIPVLEVRQGFASLSYPTKELERLVVTRRLRHGAHPVLSWCASNAVAQKDGAGNIKLAKDKSHGRIDAMAALVNAVAGWCYTAVDGTEPSVYDTRGVMVIDE
jgi:phage terminase large subunit-like protein